MKVPVPTLRARPRSCTRLRAVDLRPPALHFGAATIGLLALLVRLPWMFDRVDPEQPPDTLEYLAMASAVQHGTLFPDGALPRTPGYAYLVALCDLLPGPAAANTAAVQHLLGVVLAVAVCLLGARWFGRAVGLISGGLLAISPQMFAIEDAVLPDFMLGTLVFAACALTVWAAAPRRRTRSWPWVAVGAATAAAVLVKPVAGVLIALVPLALLPASAGWRRTALATAIAAATALVALSPWLIRNAIVHDRPSLAGQLGMTLYNRVFEIDGRPIVPRGSAQSRVAAVYGVRAVQALGLRPHAAVHGVLMERFGYDGWQASAAMRKLAVDEIRRYPFTFARRTFELASGPVRSAPGAEQAALPLRPRAGDAGTGVARASWWVSQRVGKAWWIVTLHGWAIVAGLLLCDEARRLRLLVISAGAALVALAVAATHGGVDRYWWSLHPGVVLAATAGAAAIVAAVARGRRRRRPAPPSASA